MGVPTLGCHCVVCESADPQDKRTRPSVLLTYAGRNVVIDTTPDFRFQAMRAHIDRLDAVIYTHAHADHILGLDDIRPFNIKQKSAIPIYGSPDTLATLRRQFAYIFDETPTENLLPGVVLHPIESPFELFGVRIVPVPALHGPQPVLEFSFRKSRLPDRFHTRSGGIEETAMQGSMILFSMPCATCRIRCIQMSSSLWHW